MFKNELLIKYTEFVYGIYRNVHKMYTKRILSVYIFLIGPQIPLMPQDDIDKSSDFVGIVMFDFSS